MSLLDEYAAGLREGELARVKRVMALRALVAEGTPQREIARLLNVTQPAISYQVAPERTRSVSASDLILGGGAVLRQVAESRGFTRLAVFGSAARGDAGPQSDLDLLALPPQGADQFALNRMEDLLSQVAGRHVDLVSYRGLDARLDRDILQDARPL